MAFFPRAVACNKLSTSRFDEGLFFSAMPDGVKTEEKVEKTEI